ncbi:hypothetical protein Tco_0590380, partial [Tanacetum coccineum]
VINKPRATVGDTSRTKSYIPKVSEIPDSLPSLLNSINKSKIVAFTRVKSWINSTSNPMALSEDDDEDDGASCASTPSHTTYLNSLKPLDYQQYNIPTSSEQDDDLLFECQTDLLNQTQQMHKELRGGFKSFSKALRGVFGKKKK